MLGPDRTALAIRPVLRGYIDTGARVECIYDYQVTAGGEVVGYWLKEELNEKGIGYVLADSRRRLVGAGPVYSVSPAALLEAFRLAA